MEPRSSRGALQAKGRSGMEVWRWTASVQTWRCRGMKLPVIQLFPVIQLVRVSFSSHLIMLVEVVRVDADAEEEVVVEL